jgi:hypothetical protein
MDMITKSYYAQHGLTPDFNRVFEFVIPLSFKANVGVILDLEYWNYIPNQPDRPLH